MRACRVAGTHVSAVLSSQVHAPTGQCKRRCVKDGGKTTPSREVSLLHINARLFKAGGKTTPATEVKLFELSDSAVKDGGKASLSTEARWLLSSHSVLIPQSSNVPTGTVEMALFVRSSCVCLQLSGSHVRSKVLRATGAPSRLPEKVQFPNVTAQGTLLVQG